MLLTELHAHAFEQFAVAAADLSIWVWQLMPPSVSNYHTCSQSNNYIVSSGPHTILASHRAHLAYSITHIPVNRAYPLAVKCVNTQISNSLGSHHT